MTRIDAPVGNSHPSYPCHPWSLLRVIRGLVRGLSLSPLFAGLLLLTVFAVAAEPKVRGSLSSPTVALGESVDYVLTIEGTDTPRNPPVPKVDGLEVRGTREASRLNIVNFDVSRSVTVAYTLVPKREGIFTIPEMEVVVDGRRLKTQPVILHVTPAEAMNDAGDLAFAKVWLEKKSLYIGEVVSLEVRVYLDSSDDWQLQSKPVFNGDGFTTQPMGDLVQRQVQLAGKTYHLASFSTVISPGKAGTLSVGPVTVRVLHSKGAGRPRGFFPQPRPTQEMTVTAPAIEIQVKPLPVEGRPKDFSGAIGKFEFSATGSPDRVKLGEPVSMKLTVKGHGNFDRIGQPALANPDGWTTYTAKQQFDGGENGGTVGVKTFELPVTPTAKKTTMPVFAFSFFDPEAGKYVTLNNAAAPLTVEGEPLVAPKAPAPSVAIPAVQPKVEPKAPAVQDILANLPDLGAVSAGFGPRMSPVMLFGTMFAPLPLILAVMAWRARKRDGKVARLAALRKERSALLARAKGAASRAEVLDAAVKAMCIHAQLEDGGSPPDDDSAALLASRKLPVETEKALREIFEARTELLYAGAAHGEDRIGERERDRVLEAVTAFERSARK